MLFLGIGGGFGPSMQLRSCCSIIAHPAVFWPEDAQHAVPIATVSSSSPRLGIPRDSKGKRKRIYGLRT